MRRTHTICIAACVALVIALVAYVWWYHTVASLSAQASGLTNALAARARAETRISAAQAQLAELSSQESTVDGYFISNADIVPFIEQLQSIAATAGAQTNILSVAAGTGPSPTFTIALSITGDFSHVVRAVGAIEYAPYDLIVSGLTFTSSKRTWQANMTLVVGATTASTAAAPSVGAAVPLQATSSQPKL